MQPTLPGTLVCSLHLQTKMSVYLEQAAVTIMLTALTQRVATLALVKVVTTGTENPAQVS